VAKSTDKPLYYYWDREQARLGLERWRDLYVENFLIALDRNENIIGCVAPWTGERVQRTYAQKYGPKAQNLHDMLRVLSWFRIAHPLPPEGQELEIRYLTHLHAENPDIFYSLLFHAYKQSGRREVLVYPSFEGDLLTLPPRSFI